MFAPREFSKLIGKSISTLQRWDNEGIFKARRSPTNRRYYTQEDLDYYLAGNYNKE